MWSGCRQWEWQRGGRGGQHPPGSEVCAEVERAPELRDVVEFGSSDDMVDASRFPAPHSGEKVVINAKPSMDYNSNYATYTIL